MDFHPPPAAQAQPPPPDMTSNDEPESFDIFSSLRYDPLLLQSALNTVLSACPGEPSPFYMLRYHRDRLWAAAEHFGWDKVVERLSGEEALLRLGRDLEREVDGYCGGREGGGGAQTGEAPEQQQRERQTLRLRTLFSKAGHLTVEMNPVSPVALENLFPSRLPPPSPPSTDPIPSSNSTDTSPATNHKTQTPPSTNTTLPYAIHIDTSPTNPTPYTTFKTTSRDMYTAARARAGIHSFADPAEVVLVSPTGEIMEGSLTSVYFFRGQGQVAGSGSGAGSWVTPPVMTSKGGQAGTTRRWLLERGLCTEGVVRRESVVVGEGVWVSNGVRGLIFGRVV